MRNASQRAGKAGATSSIPASSDYTRRRFLFALGASSAGAAAAAATPAIAAQASAEASVARKSASGYRETEHVRDYYDSARI